MPTRAVVPMKVKLTRNDFGRVLYPDWAQLPVVAGALAESWADRELDKHSLGSWHMDRTSDFDRDTPDSPYGTCWVMRLVSARFADEAVAAFPGIVARMTQAECATFWETKVHASEPDQWMDELLSSLLAHYDLLTRINAPVPDLNAVKAVIAKALDPLDPHPGIRKNWQRRWNDAQMLSGIVFDPSVPP